MTLGAHPAVRSGGRIVQCWGRQGSLLEDVARARGWHPTCWALAGYGAAGSADDPGVEAMETTRIALFISHKVALHGGAAPPADQGHSRVAHRAPRRLGLRRRRGW